MAARTVGFAIDESMRADLDEVVKRYADGNRSEFLRAAVRRYKADLLRERLASVREEARAERGGRIYTHDEVLELIARP